MRSPSVTRASSQKTHTRKSARISELLALVRMELTPEDKDDDMRTVETVKKVLVNGHSIDSTTPQKNGVVVAAVSPLVNGHCAPIKHNSEDEPQVVAEVAAPRPRRACKRRRQDSPEMVIKDEPVDFGYDAADPTGYGRPAEAPNGIITNGDFVPRRGPKRQARADYYDSVTEKPKGPLYTCALRFSKRCVNTSTDKSQFEPLNGVETPCRFCLIEIRSGSYKAEFAVWRDTWRANSSKVPNARWFVQDCLLPFYLRCTRCHHFRAVDRKGSKNTIKATDVTSFVCGSMGNKDTCNEPHSAMIQEAFEGPWMQSSTSFPFFLNSPASMFLKKYYLLDYMGMSPAQSSYDEKCENLFHDWSHPFYIHEHGDVVALSIAGDSMQCDESIAFPMFRKAQPYYLTCRNLILTLWHMNPLKYLTYAECEDQMICRGLSRIWYTKVLRMAYDFANAHGFINLGVVKLPTTPETVLVKPLRVVIVGAGISGISAARHLRSFGVEVVVVEAKSRIGGRLHDEHKFGTAVGRGGQIVTGLVNSPIILMCHQMGFSYRGIGGETCPMVDVKTGELADAEDDALTSLTYNTVLDGVTKWRETTKTDASLGGA